jgi:predicted alpha/beta-hydrolase family hydrolase
VFLFNGPRDAPTTLLLAHGAGAGMDTPWMERVAAGLGERGLRVARFEFPYMQKRREGVSRGGPDREPVLRAAYRAAIDQLGGGAGLMIGGKSMGGRMASLIADEAGVRGLVCLGYPFHPPGRPEKLRTAHLAALSSPALIVQGTRDPFGTPAEVEGYALSPAIRLAWIEDGDHDLRPRKSSGRSHAQNIAAALDEVVGFAAKL